MSAQNGTRRRVAKRLFDRIAAFTGPLLIIMISGSCGFVIGVLVHPSMNSL